MTLNEKIKSLIQWVVHQELKGREVPEDALDEMIATITSGHPPPAETSPPKNSYHLLTDGTMTFECRHPDCSINLTINIKDTPPPRNVECTSFHTSQINHGGGHYEIKLIGKTLNEIFAEEAEVDSGFTVNEENYRALSGAPPPEPAVVTVYRRKVEAMRKNRKRQKYTPNPGPMR